ncbi:MAG: CPBP family intramembrane metalloprotease [Oscillospiraceae bacterium]|nr:CPBP family intramembrane metalloprotease [Oscillospiraceae bacterium]
MEEVVQTKNSNERKPGLAKAIVAVSLFFASFALVFVVMLALMVLYIIVNPDAAEADIIAAMPEWTSYLPFIILTPILLPMYFKTLIADTKRLTKKNVLTIVLMSILILVIGIASTLLFGALDYSITNQEAIYETFRHTLFISMFAIVIGAPLVEELVFRKAFDRLIKNQTLFVILSSVIFALMHFSGFATIIYFFGGLIFVATYIKTDRNVMASIIVHFINNLVGFLMLLFGISFI